MSKKNLGGLDALVGGNLPPDKQPERDTHGGSDPVGENRKPAGLPGGEQRATVIVKTATWDKFKALAYWERKTQKNLLGEIIDGYLRDWEKTHGEIKPNPKKD
jgi:hypothetical protein